MHISPTMPQGTTSPSHWGKLWATQKILDLLLQIQCVEHIWAPLTTHDGRPIHEVVYWPCCWTYSTPLPNTCTNPLAKEVKADFDRDICLGVIEVVPIGESVTWCHQMVICAKNYGKPCRMIDFQPPNTHVTWENNHSQSPFHQARSIPPNTKKTVFNAWNVIMVSLSVKRITPWGGYRYCTAPYRYIASGDSYTRWYDIMFTIPPKTKCIDDTLLWADTYSTASTKPNSG